MSEHPTDPGPPAFDDGRISVTLSGPSGDHGSAPPPTPGSPGAPSMSPQQGDLIAALCKARADFGEIKKTKTGQTGNQTFKYAPLSEVHAATVLPLAKAGLDVHHVINFYDDDIERPEMEVVAVLYHSSGQWRTSSVRWARPQWGDKYEVVNTGKSSTYGRRYTFENVVGVISEEDTDAPMNEQEPRAQAQTTSGSQHPRTQRAAPAPGSCPECSKALRVSKDGSGGFYCWEKMGGCGWTGPDPRLQATQQSAGGAGAPTGSPADDPRGSGDPAPQAHPKNGADAPMIQGYRKIWDHICSAFRELPNGYEQAGESAGHAFEALEANSYWTRRDVQLVIRAELGVPLEQLPSAGVMIEGASGNSFSFLKMVVKAFHELGPEDVPHDVRRAAAERPELPADDDGARSKSATDTVNLDDLPAEEATAPKGGTE